ncbi:MAG: HAD-IIB family hydrolase [Kyrpidia sp.]|nr:HAD-IIB family hydrolase [Kyrpidia sp.]
MRAGAGIVTDLDDTLVGSADCLEAFLRWRESHPKWQLICATGRFLESALELIETERLPEPAALITDVGSRVFFPGEGAEKGWVEDSRWWSRAAATWRPAEAVRCLRGLPGFSADVVDGDDPRGPKGRISGGWDGRPETIRRVEDALKEEGLPVRVVAGRGRLDVIPATGGKGAAARYVTNHLGLRKVLACGDSGNDRDLLLAGFPSVLVGNADPALRGEPWPPLVYIASKPHACGILQGWEHWYGRPDLSDP